MSLHAFLKVLTNFFKDDIAFCEDDDIVILASMSTASAAAGGIADSRSESDSEFVIDRLGSALTIFPYL